MILITTAGKVGSEAVRLRTQKDESVRVLVRDPQKATALRQLGVDVAEGDLDDPVSVDAAMHGVTSVVLVSPAVAAQELNVIDRAARAGVGHVVKITSKLISSSEAGQRVAHHTNVIQAGKTAGIARIAYTSMLNADDTPNPLAGEHQDTERALAAADLEQLLGDPAAPLVDVVRAARGAADLTLTNPETRVGAVGKHASDRTTRHAPLSAKLRLSATIRRRPQALAMPVP